MKAILGAFIGAFALAGCGTNHGGNDGGVDASTDPPDVGQPGCAASACSSGVCAPDGGCAQTCTDNSQCATDETCCNSKYCSNLKKDPQNCGACGTACGPKQYCSGTACFDALVNNLCQNASASVVLDSITTDEEAGTTISTAMKAGCPQVTIGTIQQGAAGSMDPQSGRPLLGPGNTYVAAGGGYGQKAVAYMNGARNAPVYTIDDSQNISFVRASDNGTIVKTALSALTAHHDYFLIYAAAEPVSGTLVFAVYGLYGPGTTAGAFWFQTEISTKVSTYTKQYYVYEWTDTNNDGAPNPTDTFNLIESN
jgi:hypothetical protein